VSPPAFSEKRGFLATRRSLLLTAKRGRGVNFKGGKNV